MASTPPAARAAYGAAQATGSLASRRAASFTELGQARYRGWNALVVPMVYQERPIGALAAFSQESLDQVDTSSLTVLANQATVALQNTDMFERERETVVRLQELDSMKSDFLATIQHELRTPLTAIMGMTDLLEMAWASWSDAQKLDAVNDVQLAAKGLFELVETILDYSLIESNRLDPGDGAGGLSQRRRLSAVTRFGGLKETLAWRRRLSYANHWSRRSSHTNQEPAGIHRVALDTA